MSERFLIADGPNGRLFACIADSRFTEAAVSPMRLGASLRPFKYEERARLALNMAGGTNIRPAE